MVFLCCKAVRREKNNIKPASAGGAERKDRAMHLEKQIELDQVKEMWCNLAVTQQAKDTIRGISFYLDEGVLRKQLKDTTNSKELLQKLGMPPLQSLDESKEGLKLAAKGG